MDLERLGPYQIVGKLGRGGMGTVYDAVHRATGEPAAVKLLSASLAQEEGFRIRFEAEIETLRKLNHPNIVRLYGFGEQQGHLFYAMELVDGNSLEEELRRGRRFDWREVVRIGIETCRALRHAHDRGVIHRDIKPGNLLLATDGRVKLSDFGIARLFGNTRMTMVGNVVGTAEYMAPEQAEGQAIDARADLYSLGVLMYALLARRPVFRGKSLAELLHKHRFEQPEPLRNAAPDAPEELEHIVSQLLEKDPNRRIPNASILGRRLEAMLHSLSVSNPETVEADPGWFLPAQPSSAFSDEPTPQPEIASTFDRSADDLPVTFVLQPSVEHQREVEAVSIHPGDHRATPPPSDPTAGAATAPETTSEPGRFTLVSEEELDQAEEEEPRSWWPSWQTWALAGALLLVGLTMRWFLQPPTADSLYQRIEPDIEDDSPMSPFQLEQATKAVNDLLVRYSNDPRAAKVREYEKKFPLRTMEWDFNQRITQRKGTDGLSLIEQMYMEAISHTRLNPTLAMTKLQAIVDLYNQPEDDKKPTGQCVELARRQLEKLRKQVSAQAKSQLVVLREHLDAAAALVETNPEQAQAMYRAIIELYSDKPWAADIVRHAREALTTLSK